MRIRNVKYLKSPFIEMIIMGSSIVLSYLALIVLGSVPEALPVGAMTTATVVSIQFAFFILSISIALISVVAGIGGGVIFTPIMLAFTPVNSVIIRGTGLIVAMFSSLVSTGVFIRKGLCNYRLTLMMTVSQSAGALIGAVAAVSIASAGGDRGDGLLRLSLGIILAALTIYLFVGGKKKEHPAGEYTSRFAAAFGLNGEYYEESEKRNYTYQVKRIGLGMVLILTVGFIGGFFGMGGGWAITPILNLGMNLPLKTAAATSNVILGIGSCVSIWPYIYTGAIIPFFVLPWLAGLVIGGFIGSYALAKVRVNTVRLILIGIMLFTSFGLVTRALTNLGVMSSDLPAVAQVGVFAVIITGVIAVIIREKRKTPVKTSESGITAAEAEKPQFQLPLSNRCFSSIVHTVTVFASIAALFIPVLILLNPENNILNPHIIFQSIFSGASISEIWEMSPTGGFPGAHYYLSYLIKADSWAQLVIALGCSVGLWALIPTVVIQFAREKEWLWGAGGAVLAALMALALAGVF